MIVVVIPDAGPLISLARADRLDLLDRFNSQILITDAFKFEVLGGRLRSADQERLHGWMQSGNNRIRVVETPWGATMLENFRLREALSWEEKASVPRNPLLRNAGERSICDLAEEIRHGMSQSETALVLVEHKNVIPSASDLFDQIELAGSVPPRSDYDWVPKDGLDDFAESYDVSITELSRKSSGSDVFPDCLEP